MHLEFCLIPQKGTWWSIWWDYTAKCWDNLVEILKLNCKPRDSHRQCGFSDEFLRFAKFKSVWLILSRPVNLGWLLCELDICNTFLSGVRQQVLRFTAKIFASRPMRCHIYHLVLINTPAHRINIRYAILLFSDFSSLEGTELPSFCSFLQFSFSDSGNVQEEG